MAQAVATIGALIDRNEITAQCGKDLVVWSNQQAATMRGDGR